MLAVALLAVGAGMQAYGQYQSAQASAMAARQNARLKQAQADEMLSKMRVQEERIRSQGEAFKAEQINEYASNGIQLGTGSTLVSMEDANMKISQQVDDMRRDTIFKANQIRLGASFDNQQAADTSKAGTITALGSLLGGAAAAHKNT